MKAYTIINSGLEKVAGKETEELLNYKIKVKPSVIELDVSPQELVNYSFKVQSARRVLVALGECKDLDSFQFLENLQDLRYTIKVEGVKGQNNRQKIAKQLGKIITAKKEIKFDYKNPDVIIVVFFNGESYFIGLDVMGTELDQRHYRVFPHSASFKGDFAYFFLRKSGFVKGNSFLMDFCKDGSIPIEAAIYESGSLVQDLDETYSFEKIDLFKGCQKPIFIKNDVNNIIAVDETMQNTNAARKNAKLANVNVDIRKYDLHLI